MTARDDAEKMVAEYNRDERPGGWERLVTHIATLAEGNTRLSDEVGSLTSDCTAMLIQRNAARAETARLRKALKRYGRHERDCHALPYGRCSCGWDQTVESLVSPSPTTPEPPPQDQPPPTIHARNCARMNAPFGSSCTCFVSRGQR